MRGFFIEAATDLLQLDVDDAARSYAEALEGGGDTSAAAAELGRALRRQQLHAEAGRHGLLLGARLEGFRAAVSPAEAVWRQACLDALRLALALAERDDEAAGEARRALRRGEARPGYAVALAGWLETLARHASSAAGFAEAQALWREAMDEYEARGGEDGG